MSAGAENVKGPDRAGAPPYFLMTERLGFRPWKENDLDLAVGLWGDPDVTRHIDARGRLTVDQVRERLSAEIATARRHGVQYWPIFLLRDGDHVGCCGLRPRDPRGPVFEIGVHIRSRHWRKGYAQEATAAVIDHAFDRLGAVALFAGHHPDNAVSRRLLENLRFRHTHDEPYPPTGLDHPSYLLRRDEHGPRIRSGT